MTYDGATTIDHLLDMRVRYRQPSDGFRAAIDPVLLAAAIPARAGDRVLEGGTGAGAAMLCLAARVPRISGLGIDRDCQMCALAQENAVANGFSGLMFVAGDLDRSPVGGAFDHAFANPPYHAETGTASPAPSRESAKRAPAGMMDTWTVALSRPLRHRGTLTFILPSWLIPSALAAMTAAKVPAETMYPIWPKQGRPARFILVQGRKNGRAPLTIMPGIVLHHPDGSYAPDAEAILRHAAGLLLG